MAYPYPIYDAQGNRVATLTKCGTSISLTDVRTYHVWGNVRVGSQIGRPRARYWANQGHVQDDESGLVYMRARYYEPSSGRFVSEDSNRHGGNWFAYCGTLPTTRIDYSGNNWTDWSKDWWLTGELLSALAMAIMYAPSPASALSGLGAAGLAIFCFSMALVAPGMSGEIGVASGFFALFMAGSGPWVNGILAEALPAAQAGQFTVANRAVAYTFIYGLEVMGALAAIDLDSDGS